LRGAGQEQAAAIACPLAEAKYDFLADKN